jgi:hypothetical protein
MKHEFSNGTVVVIGPHWCVTTLPNGKEVHAHPNDKTLEMARKLGYEEDIDALTRDHDLLHTELMSWLEQPYSYSLMHAAGETVDMDIVQYEEEAVLALQKLKKALKRESVLSG